MGIFFPTFEIFPLTKGDEGVVRPAYRTDQDNPRRLRDPCRLPSPSLARGTSAVPSSLDTFRFHGSLHRLVKVG